MWLLTIFQKGGSIEELLFHSDTEVKEYVNKNKLTQWGVRFVKIQHGN